MSLDIANTPSQENKWGLRHIMGIMGTTTLAVEYMQKFCLGLAITEMVRFHPKRGKMDEQTCPFVLENTTVKHYMGEFDWDEETQGLILSSMFWGSIISHVPGGLMAERWGAKSVLGYCMLICSIGTLLIPIVSRTFGSWGLICARIFIGLGSGTVYPSLNVLMSNWCPANERGLLGAIVFAGGYLGNFFSMAISGLIISYLGWTGVFYIYGGLGLVWICIWVIFYHNSPLEHPFIKEEERNYITKTSGKTCYKDLPPTPWIPILTSIPVWALVISLVGHNWGVFVINTDLPKYMKSVLHLSVKENGAVSGLPHLGMWLASMTTGWAMDLMIFKFGWGTSLVRKFSITLAAILPSVGMMAASYSGCDKTLATVFFVFGMAMMGAYMPGSKANILDLGPNYAGTILAWIGTMGAISGIVTPYLIGVLTPNSTLLEWRLVFWISFAVIMGSNLAYVLMGTSATQWWNDPDRVRSYFNTKGKSDGKDPS